MSSVNVQAKHPQNFKGALHESLFDEAGKPVKELADIAGVAYSTLCEWADEARPESWPSMRRFLRLLPNLRNLAVLDYMERLVGRIAFRVPDAREVCGQQMGNSLKEYGEFVVEATNGGPMTAEKADRIEKEGREAMATIAAVIECSRQQVQHVRDLRAVLR